MNRRELLNILFFSLPLYYGFGKKIEPSINKFETSQASKDKFNKIVNKYLNNPSSNYSSINKYIIDFATEFIGNPYKAGTLEGDGEEICRFDLTGFDCVTLVEATLCLSRIFVKGIHSIEDFANELILTRYRNGLLDDYTSRLHYTSDWIYDNIKKNVVEDMTKELGGEKFPLNVSFMSANPEFYPSLKKNKELIIKMKKIENDINSRKYFYISKEKVVEIEPFLRNGDIICIATNKKGLDYSHLGLAYIDKTKDNVKARFLHASSKQKKVIIDTSISDYLARSSNSIGITIARPIEV